MIVRCEKWLSCPVGANNDCPHYYPHEYKKVATGCVNTRCKFMGEKLTCLEVNNNIINKAFNDIDKIIFGDELDKYEVKEPVKKNVKKVRKKEFDEWVSSDDMWTT